MQCQEKVFEKEGQKFEQRETTTAVESGCSIEESVSPSHSASDTPAVESDSTHSSSSGFIEEAVSHNMLPYK